MTALPLLEISEGDPRWREMQQEKMAARVRFGTSEAARLELARSRDPLREKPDWTWSALPAEHPFEVFRWD